MKGWRDEAGPRRPAPEGLAHPAGLQHAELQPRHFLQGQRHADAGGARADDGDIQALHQAFRFLAPPCRALKRGLDLQMM